MPPEQRELGRRLTERFGGFDLDDLAVRAKIPQARLSGYLRGDLIPTWRPIRDLGHVLYPVRREWWAWVKDINQAADRARRARAASRRRERLRQAA
ncbi:hypothetical protein [Actinoplanes sp. N902-109]|uniref:hypothetical protein n=1 Tax=Actinoplanes sp. (strain N902-109) TaxID=649831 RepID=UPI0003294442|nr:hypothetical protein [Actinoplanes sp. N902-109]AGL17281.1 hypothetical protein L083_3771 [Actinoplanes sp. N902-109]